MGQGRRVPDGLVQHPVPQRVHEAHGLGQGDEPVRTQQTADGVLPAHQGLDRDHLPGGEVHDRLVVEDELGDGPLERQPELRLQAPA